MSKKFWTGWPKKSGKAAISEKLDRNFCDFTSSLNASNLHYWVGSGSLLGLVRDGDFLPWDSDIDICMNEESFDLEITRDIVARQGFLLSSVTDSNIKFVRPGGRMIDINLYSREIRTGRSGENQPVRFIRWTVRKPVFGLGLLYPFLWDLHRFLEKQTHYKNLGREVSRFGKSVNVVFSRLANWSRRLIAWVEPRRFDGELLVEYALPECMLDMVSVRTPEATWFQPVDSEGVLRELYGRTWGRPKRVRRWWSFASRVRG